MIRYPLPDEAIPPRLYDDEPSVAEVLDEAIRVADEDAAGLRRGIENALLITGGAILIGLLTWLFAQGL